jgi:ferredoxin-NADP reductase
MHDTERSDTPRRETDFCPMHKANTDLINQQGHSLGKHSGQWKVLLIMLGSGITAMASIAGTAYYHQQETMTTIAASVHSIDKVMTAYVSSHTAESIDGFRRISSLEVRADNFETRIDTLERK